MNKWIPIEQATSASASSQALLFWTSVLVLILSGVVLPEIVGFLRSDYCPVSNYISELGEQGAAHAALINYFGFLPVAISSAIALHFLAKRHATNTWGKIGFVMWTIGLSGGYLSAFVFPCDLGCPIEGSTRQMIHNIAGLITYPATVLGLAFIAIGLKRRAKKALLVSIIGVALMAAVGFAMIITPEQVEFRGLWQRLVDYAMFLLIVGLGIELPVA